MPTRSAHSEALRAGTPFTVGSVTLLPIERVVMSLERANPWAWVLVTKEAHALIMREADGVRAVETDATAISLEAPREKVPGLDILLAAM